MRIALESLDSRAPWLERTDAVSTQRLRSLTGMDGEEWGSWLAIKPSPRGRIGSIVTAELDIGDSAPLSIEWKIGNTSDHVQLHPTPEISVEGDRSNQSQRMDRSSRLTTNRTGFRYLD